MIKHKKTLSVFIVVAILLIAGLIFIDPIIQKTANTFLDPINENFRAQVRDLDIDVSKGRATFSLTATNRKSGKEFLEVKEVTADIDPGGMSVKVNDVSVTASHQLLQMLQNQTQEKSKDEDSPSQLPLGFLSTFELNNLKLKLPHAEVTTTVGKVLMNFEQGTGIIQNIKGQYLPADLQFLKVPRISLNFGKDVFIKEDKKVSITVQNPSIKVTEEFLSAIRKEIPQVRQAQTEKSNEKEEDSSSPLEMLNKFQIQNFSFDFIGKTHISSGMNQLMLNFPEGTGSISHLSTRIKGQNAPLLFINTIKMNFEPEGLTSEKSSALKVEVNGTKVNILEGTAEALKSLPKPQEKEAQEEQGPGIFKELRNVSVLDTNIYLEKQGLRTSIEDMDLDMRSGEASVTNITGKNAKTKKQFLKVEKVSAAFNPEKLSKAEKPEIKMIVSDVHLKVSDELLKQLKSEEQVKKPPQSLPVHFSSILFSNSSISFLDYPGIGQQQHLVVKEIFGGIKNLTLESGTPLADFKFNATFEGDAKFMANGQMDLADDPIQWSLNYKLFHLDMTKLNPELRARIPLTFTDGVLDFYGEVIKRDEKIIGYYKPILGDAEYLGNKGEFKGIRHFFAETFATFTNWLFERDETDSVATRVPFVFEDGKMNVDVSKTIWNTVEHGLLETKRIKPGVEHKYRLKEAQEEK